MEVALELVDFVHLLVQLLEEEVLMKVKSQLLFPLLIQ
jgi:hypothetical protein